MLELGRLSGAALAALATAMRAAPFRAVAARAMRAQLGIDAARALPPDARGPLPVTAAALQARSDQRRPSLELGRPAPPQWPHSITAYGQAYQAGRAAPALMVARALQAARELATRAPSLGPLCGYDDERAHLNAEHSRGLLESGQARGELEGVPIVVKEELDVEGLPTRIGTGFMPYYPAARDAVSVARLRALGSAIIGQTSMTEYGMSPLGANAHRRMPRNAHHPGRLPGGSSSGSAVAVALGLVPLALATDGGGSIRIPAAFNGIFGLKGTYGRVPLVGQASPSVMSVVHIGALAGNSTDLALAFEAMSGGATGDELSLLQPELESGELLAALGRGVKGLRIGVDEQEWQAAADDAAGPARAALDALQREGAELVPVQLPLAPHAAAIGYLTIALEAYAGLRQVRLEHLTELGYDMQVMLAGLQSFEPDDYLDAQRLRVGLRRELADVLRNVDVLALPSTARSAPPITDKEAQSGIIDPPALHDACRFAFLANLTGLPAASIPVGSDSEGMPVGLQIIGDAWDEACVLQVAAHLERIGAARVIKPAAAVDLFG